MPTDVLFIHSAGPQSAGQGSSPLVKHLRQGLGPGFRVHGPTMPLPHDPSYERWRAELVQRIPADHPPRILVGHSLGGSVLLKYLTECERAVWPAALFLVATPWWGVQDWDTREFELRDGFARSLPDTLSVRLYQSRDDEVVSFEHLARYAAAMPQAVTCPLERGGHTFPDGLPELVRDIRASVEVRR